MCLAVPGKVVEITGEGDLRMGKVDFSGVQRQACLAYVPEVRLGDYVLVPLGFALSRNREPGARATAGAPAGGQPAPALSAGWASCCRRRCASSTGRAAPCASPPSR